MEVDTKDWSRWSRFEKLKIVCWKKKIKIINFPKQYYRFNEESELINWYKHTKSNFYVL